MQETKIDRIDLDSRPAKTAAEEAAAAPPEKTGRFKAKNIKILIIVVGVIILFGSVVAAGIYLGWIPIPGVSLAKKNEEVHNSAAIGPMLKISPLIINLKEEGGKHYIKTTIVLELGQPDWVEEVRSRMPLLTDLVILTLSDKRLGDLKNAEAKENFKKDLLLKINQSLGSPKVKQIYFDEFLYQ
jgi:flagellar FliL protein